MIAGFRASTSAMSCCRPRLELSGDQAGAGGCAAVCGALAAAGTAALCEAMLDRAGCVAALCTGCVKATG